MSRKINGFYFFGELPKESFDGKYDLEIYCMKDNISYFKSFIAKNKNDKVFANLIKEAHQLIIEREDKLKFLINKKSKKWLG